jgi:hypothetical protein
MKELINLNWDDESRDRQHRLIGLLILSIVIVGLLIASR